MKSNKIPRWAIPGFLKGGKPGLLRRFSNMQKVWCKYLVVLMLLVGVNAYADNGHHHGGGNSGNGKGNQPVYTPPGDLPDPGGDPDEPEPTNVPLDNLGGLSCLVLGGIGYAVMINRKKNGKTIL